jgi:uncharacterized protein YbgA (DUF1722 family)/uncharacterized protein YbbK (DUF523 family)
MTSFARPRVVVSRCLGFDACRWNGATIPDDYVDALKPFVDFIKVCPEVDIGLGVPRKSIRLIESAGSLRLIQQDTNQDVSADMTKFADTFLDNLRDVDGFILKSRSPSCGIKDSRVYPDIGKVASIRNAPGLFGGTVLKRFSRLAIEDEGRFNNERIWDHFLKKLFTLAGFRERVLVGDINDLIKFHSQNKMLLMSYNQNEMRIMGRIVSNKEGKRFDEVAIEYRSHLGSALANIPRPTSTINVALHMLGFSSDSLSHAEKAYFLDSVDRYRNGTIPIAVLTYMLKSWAIRFDQTYMLAQTFLDPYPSDLLKVIKTGEPRDLKL